MLSPPYMSMSRPTFSGQPAKMLYGKQYTLTVSLPKGTKKVQAFVMDLGYSTHGVHMSQRMVELAATLKGNKLTVTAPKTTGLYPPGARRRSPSPYSLANDPCSRRTRLDPHPRRRRPFQVDQGHGRPRQLAARLAERHRQHAEAHEGLRVVDLLPARQACSSGALLSITFTLVPVRFPATRNRHSLSRAEEEKGERRETAPNACPCRGRRA